MEDKFRSFIKSISWRVIGILNGWTVTYLFIDDIGKSFMVSIVANISGFMLYYIHERTWNKSNWRRK